jgi:replicative DNA helicase
MQSDEYDNVLFSFLGCVMKTPELLYESRLTAAMIGNSQDGSSLPARMFSILKNQVDKHISVDYRTVYDEISAISGSDTQFPSNKAFNMLEEINHYVASSANWKYFESRLLDHWAQKRIDDVCKMVQEIKGPSVTAQDKVAHLEKAISEINLVETEFNIVTIRESLHGVVEKIEERYKNKDLIGISTGIDLLDSSTYGFQPGQFWVIGGRPSQGKSALMGQLHRNIAMRKKESCGVISIE